MKRFQEFLSESKKEYHVSTTILTGLSPHSHMGHVKDIGNILSSTPSGKKIFSISNKADHFSPNERQKILKRQLEKEGHKNIEIYGSNGMGDTVRHAASYVKNKSGKKILHLVAGMDRQKIAKRLRHSILNGKIGGISPNLFHEIKIHNPQDKNRSHGLSGTKMRLAAKNDDLETYHKHLGSNFTKNEAKRIMLKTKNGINTNKISLKR